jgi:hypothetical protein
MDEFHDGGGHHHDARDLMSIEIFRELILRGEESALVELMEHLSEHPADEWVRHRDVEERSRVGREDSLGPFCFVRTPEDETLVAALWVYPKEQGQLYVSNIVPWARDELTRAQYNETLIAFYRAMVVPSAGQFGVQPELTGDQQDIKELLSPRAAEALERFSALANRATGAGHPLDQRRWESFLILAFIDRCAADSDTLRRWLVESEGWPEEVAWDMAEDYSTGFSLLQSYDQFRHSRG